MEIVSEVSEIVYNVRSDPCIKKNRASPGRSGTEPRTPLPCADGGSKIGRLFFGESLIGTPSFMVERIFNSLLSALIGGLVAVCIVVGSERAPKIDSLEVRDLRVTGKMVLHDPVAEQDQVVIESGSVLAANKIVATQFLGSQVNGSVLVANRLYTTPDNLAKVPAGDWKFFTELGADENGNGELLVRSATGWSGVDREIAEGTMIRFGFDRAETAQMFSQNNETRETTAIQMERPRARPGRFAERFRTGAMESGATAVAEVAHRFHRPEHPRPVPEGGTEDENAHHGALSATALPLQSSHSDSHSFQGQVKH